MLSRSDALRVVLSAALLGCTLLSPSLRAQWSGDPALNLAVADATSDQVQPKVEPTSSGGSYVSWFDGIATGFDVRIQLLDEVGAEVFPHGGVLVADRDFSSTQDYGLDISDSGNALLAYRSKGPVSGSTVIAEAVNPDGEIGQLGGSSVTLVSTTDFVAAPKIAGTSDNGAVVAWTQNNTVHLQKLNAAGVAQWNPDIVLAPPMGSYSVADLHAVGNDVILSFVHQTGGFGSPRQLRAQKFDSSGAQLWGAAHISVFNTGSLQFGNFPSFVPTGTGGALFSWYDASSSQLDCYASLLHRSGQKLFGQNGVSTSSNASRLRVSPNASFDELTGHSTVSWVELNANQSQSGVYSQRFDGVGNRLWGAEGVELVPVSSTQVGNVRTLDSADSSMVFWIEELSFGDDRVKCFRVFDDGQSSTGPFDVATSASGKSRLAVARNSQGQSVLAWTDDRIDNGDVYAQNVNCDGSLGAPALSAAWTDLSNALAGVSGLPALSGSGTLCPDAPYSITLANAAPSAPLAIVLGFGQLAAPLKGGVLVPTPDKIFFNLSSNPAGGLAIGSNWPSSIPSGFELVIQIWVTDAVGLAGFAASNGLLATTP